jgi:hypothetical protein
MEIAEDTGPHGATEPQRKGQILVSVPLRCFAAPCDPVIPVPSVTVQKLNVTLNRTNRGATIDVGRSHVAPVVA